MKAKYMSTPSIDEILASVRAQTSLVNRQQTDESRRNLDQMSSIPVLIKPDDGSKLPLDQPLYTIEEFTALDDEDFLRNAYRIVLGREIDGVGRNNYLTALKQGQISVIRVLSGLRRSAEGRAHGAKIRWLMPAALLDRLVNFPIIGRFFEPLLVFIVRSTTNQRLSILSERHNDIILDVNSALSSIRKNQTISRKNQIDIEQKFEDMKKRMEEAIDTATSALSELRATRSEVARQRTALGQFLEVARGKSTLETQSSLMEIEEAGLDTFYVAFENRFRGSTDEISARSERYLPIFRSTFPVTAGGIVLDIGCGRGEFLSLLKCNNISTRGIDINKAMVDEAIGLDLDVIEGDAISYLWNQPENSLAAITGFHIVEHINFKDLIKLFDAARRALMPNGFILFETPNPENLVVGACTFNYDPTHNKPLPPDYLRFVAEARGFKNVRIIREDSDCDLSHPESGFSPEGINDWFRQPPDYAIYASKPEECKEI